MPYMGSKRKIAPAIIDYILSQNPQCKYFYDLFGGGGAISFEVLQRSQIKQVTYNELNTGVVELLRKIQREGITEEFYQWIPRETFNAHKNDNDWFGGLCKTVWSFGNDQKNYLFGAHIEEYKRMYHEVCVNKIDHTEKMARFCEGHVLKKHGITQTCNLTMPTGGTLQERSLEIRTQLIRFEKSCKVEQIIALCDLQRLEQLERLRRLEQLQQLQQITITNQSYIDVKINTPIDETIIYLDPPYKNTGTYQKQLCHNELLNYVKKSPYKIYVSSYNFEMPCVWQINKKESFSSARNMTVEKLFCNREEQVFDPRQVSLF